MKGIFLKVYDKDDGSEIKYDRIITQRGEIIAFEKETVTGTIRYPVWGIETLKTDLSKNLEIKLIDK